jgi:hypothetical protein
MNDTHSSRTSRHIVTAMVLAMAGLATGAALAGNGSPPALKSALPGVSADYRIVRPAPEPRPEPDDALPGSGNGQFKIGDTDVRISGSITFDVAAGAIKPPR